MRLHFENAKDGFLLSNGAETRALCEGEKLSELGFEIAGEDGAYVPAEAVIENETIFVRSDKVSTPVFARYQWTNYAEVRLFGKNGIPVAPFRTSWNDGFVPLNQKAEIGQKMECATK